jgi:peptidoglycan LD-endopeptidase CwlK
MDKVTQDRIALLHPKIREEVRLIVDLANSKLTGRAQVRIVEGLRTFEEQTAIYNQGRTTKGPIVTKAKAGQSYHNYGLGIDYCLLIDGKEISWDSKKDFDADGIADWMEVVKIFEEHGYTWGKAFNDLPHMEKTFGHNWRILLEKYKNKDFIPGTKYVNI